MKLEEAIKQEKFRSEKQKAILNIYYTNGYITSAFEKLFKQFDLTSQQYNILRILRGRIPMLFAWEKLKNVCWIKIRM